MSTANWNVILTVATSFAVTVVCILLLRPIAIRFGLTDQPGGRKQHKGSIPLVGGIAIYIAVAVSVLLEFVLNEHLLPDLGTLVALGAAGALLVTVGVVDDRSGLTPGVRLIAETCAALLMAAVGGIVLYDVGYLSGGSDLVSLGIFAVPFTVFATVGVINAVNMSDGLDGLCGNLTLVSLLGLGIANALWGGADRLQLLNILSAALAGFLLFNQRSIRSERATVFLGDAGSMLLGFFLAWSAIEVSQGVDRVIRPAAALWFLLVPLYDSGCVMVRRLLKGTSPFTPDSRHLHHMFTRSGFDPSETTFWICVMAAAGCLTGLAVENFLVKDQAVVLLFVLGYVLYVSVIDYSWRKGRFLGRTMLLDEAFVQANTGENISE